MDETTPLYHPFDATKPRNELIKIRRKLKVIAFVVRSREYKAAYRNIGRTCNHAFSRALFFLNIPVIISDANLFIGRVYFRPLFRSYHFGWFGAFML